MFIALLVVAFILGSIICMRYYQRYVIWTKIRQIPGPPTLPLIGNLHIAYGDQEFLWKFARKLNEQYYPISRFWTPHWLVVNLVDPSDVEALLTNVKHITKSNVYNTLRPWLRDGLLTSTGKLWQHRRKTLTPAFHFHILKKYMDSILEHSESMIQSLKNDENEIVKELEPWVTDFTLSVICEAAMGVALHDVDSQEARDYKNAVNFMGTIVTYRVIRPWYIPDFIFELSPMGWKQRKALKTLHGFSTKIINERKQFHHKTNGKYLTEFNISNDKSGDIQTAGIGSAKRLAMLDLLIAAYRNGQISDIGIREEVDTFIFEGYDTTAMALCYTLLLLAEHTDVQQRVRDEIDCVWEECNGNIKMSELQRLTYLDCCIKESLRLYPSVPFISRQITEELHLNDHVIPPGMLVNVHIYDMHRDPNNWSNPTKFDPDRFLPGRSEGRHPFSYIPFSGGFRNCIGQKFAMLEIKSFIGFLLRHFRVEAIDKTSDIKHKVDLVLRASNHLRIKLVPIDRYQTHSSF